MHTRIIILNIKLRRTTELFQASIAFLLWRLSLHYTRTGSGVILTSHPTRHFWKSSPLDTVQSVYRPKSLADRDCTSIPARPHLLVCTPETAQHFNATLI